MRSVFDATDQSPPLTDTVMERCHLHLDEHVTAASDRAPPPPHAVAIREVAHLIYRRDRSACPHLFLKAPEVSFPVLCLT